MSDIKLEFETNTETNVEINETASTEIVEELPSELDKLSEEEKAIVNDFVKKIDLQNTLAVTSYGKGSQSKISDFSANILSEVKLKDTGEIGESLSNLMSEIQSIEEEDKKGIFKIFSKGKNNINKMLANYSSSENAIQEISNTLESQKIRLLKDIQLLDDMYENNKSYFKELNLYIVAGNEKLNQYHNVDIKKQQEIVEATNDEIEVQKLNNMIQDANRFEKRLHDLKITKTISLQMAPQIKMLQNNNVILVDKIDSSILNTIPLWRNQMVLAVGLQNNKEALDMQKSINDATNDMLKKNSQMLKQGTVELAIENERSIVDIDTLKETNKNLIETINEVITIQKEGQENRRNAENELSQIENELKTALINSTQR